jgi:tetratricopeptide (TPR) repeat protein
MSGEIGDALFDLEDYSAAVKAYRLALNFEKSPGMYTSLGSAITLDERVDRRFELALDEYTNALRLAPDHVPALKSRAVVRLYLCQYDEALADSQAAEKHGPDTAGMFFTRALIYSALGDLHQARKCATRAVKDATEEDRTQWFEYVYAHITADLGDLDEAIQALERAEALAMNRGDSDLLAKVDGLRGLVLARLGQFDRARVSCESSLTRTMGAAEPYATLAWICQQTGHVEEASVRIEQAISLIEKSTTWQNDCQYQGAKWPFYLLQAAILNAVAEQYDDLRAAEGALAAANNAQSDRDKDGRKQSEQNDERSAQIFLERARSHALCKEHQQVAADLNECLKLAPRNSRASYAATRALRYSATRNLEIDARLIVLVEVLLLAGVVALFLTSTLTSGALATIVLGVLALGLAAFCLPVITEMRIGTLQLNKTVAAAISTPLPKLDTPLPGVRLPSPKPKARRSLPSMISQIIISQMRPRTARDVAGE